MTNFAFVSGIAKNFAGQRTSVRVLEVSGAAMAVAVGFSGPHSSCRRHPPRPAPIPWRRSIPCK